MIDDDDRIYIVNTDWLRENVRRDPDPPPEAYKFEMLPTDDPEKYIMRVTAPMPKFYIKNARVNA